MIRVKLTHLTDYTYDRPVRLSPHVIRLRPAPHTRTVIESYSLTVDPAKQFLNWQQDPFANWQARLVFPEPTRQLSVRVDLVAQIRVFDPFDFFTEEYATKFPFEYAPRLRHELLPYLTVTADSPDLREFAAGFKARDLTTVDFIVALNQYVRNHVNYVIRLEPGVQTPQETLAKKSGSCRDSAYLLVQLARSLGLAARFVSGYLIQLKPDKPGEGEFTGVATDFTDLHAWTEIYVPGAGWIGLDATSGLLAAEGHIPLAATPGPWNVLGEEVISGSVSRAVDSATERVQVLVRGNLDETVITCNGYALPLRYDRDQDCHVGGVVFKAWSPPFTLHPTVPVHSPLQFCIYDRRSREYVGGLSYHTSHPGGRAYEKFPVNSYEAESRRLLRFLPQARYPQVPPVKPLTGDFPHTLDLRREG